MRGKLMLLALLIWAVGGQIGYAGLVAYWNLEEGSGTVTTAVVGSPQADGKLVGATWITTDLAPIGGTTAAVFFKSANADRVETNYPGVLGQAARSVTVWIRAEPTQTNNGTMVGWGANTNDQRYSLRINKTAADGVLSALRLEIQGSRAVATTPVLDRQWHHVAVTHGAGARIGEVSFYVDGKPDVRSGTPGTAVINTASTSVVLGNSGHATGTYGFDGAIDEVRIYDHVLTQAEIQQIMRGAPAGRASGPNPANKAVDVLRDTALSWTAGQGTGTRDVYLGTTRADVNTAGRTDAKGALASQGQTEAGYRPAHALAYGQTYYWRIDEINKTPDNTVFKGDVWSFTVEPYAYPIKPIAATASSSQPGMGPEKTIDGSGLTGDLHGTEPTTMWLSAGAGPDWIQYEFDQVCKLHQLVVWNSNQLIEAALGFGSKNVTVEGSTDGKTWVRVNNVPDFGKAPGTAGYAANTTVSLGGALAKYVKLTITTSWGGVGAAGLSEVRFFCVPLQARAPQPATAATGVGLDATLDWRPGREAASHKVCFGTDPNAVAQGTAPAKAKTDRGYTPDSLNLGTTYYWRVDEVNTVTYPGEVWSFTTREYKVVDDFEGYTDKPGEEVFSTWIDGFADNYQSSGSTVGLATARNGTFGETTIFHSGKQSMPLAYDNTKAPNYSEAVRTFNTAQDWTANGVQSLSLWFQGAPGNSGQLYVKINGTKVLYDGEATDLSRTTWLVWNIDLSKAGKVNSVRSLTLGIEGAGAKGALYFDDLRLYPGTPEYLTPVQPAATNLVAYYTFDEGTGTKVGDSSGKGNHGTTNGKVQWGAGKIGGAMQFDGTSGYVTIPFSESLRVLNRGNGFTVTAWFNARAIPTENKMIFQQGDLNGTGRTWLFVSSANEVRSSLGNVATQTGFGIEANAWYHVALVVQEGGTADTVQIYLNGRPAGAATTRTLEDSEGIFYIGCHKALTNFWDGQIDDLRVYHRPLSAAEVAGLAGLTLPLAKPF